MRNSMHDEAFAMACHTASFEPMFQCFGFMQWYSRDWRHYVE